MEVNELMIGDWVHLVDDNTPRQVDWIRSGEVGLFWNKTVTPPYLEPIPITPGILEKNGFEFEGNKFSFYKRDGERTLYVVLWSAKESYLEIASYTSGIGEFNRSGIMFVHQLQHALRLCGIDNEIKL